MVQSCLRCFRRVSGACARKKIKRSPQSMKEIDVAFTVCIYCRMLLNFRVFFFCVSILIDLSHIMCNNDVTPLLYCHTNRSLIFGAVGRLDRDALQRFTIYGLGFIWLFKQADRALRGRSKDHKGTYLTRRMKYCTLKKTKKKVRTSGRKIICEYRSKRAGLLTWLETVIMGAWVSTVTIGCSAYVP